ncbi:TonB-dependent receptor [Govanella unica]|uniref:TonB-dependent receptor n=1 Tax=Govanella unica TaxID=2975056 RepID=A0A9X3U055_9PROT|nr:TonB-dependent receptor [Govania unica]MDA5194998.1 TonB-dependent receptor [Govania unica]
MGKIQFLPGILVPILAFSGALAAESKIVQFDVDAQSASSGIREFAQQAGVPILAPSEVVSDKRINAVGGTMEVEQALKLMLRGTKINYKVDRGAIILSQLDQSIGTAALPFPVAMQAEADNRLSAPAATREPEVEIVVTGSRVARNGFEAPTPMTVLTAEEMSLSASPNVADALNKLPILRPSLTASSTTSNSNYSGGNYLDLRGLGANRTLVLVDGKRFVSSIVEGPTDINVIPQALIAGVDVVTGGASAAYGSDAVGGVVNLRLDHNLEGVRATLQGGITDHNDHRNYLASLAVGQGFSGGRGKLLLSVEAAQNSGVFSLSRRDWGRDQRGAIANPAYTATNDEPRNLLVNNALRSNTSYGGVINSGPLKGIQFAPDGSAIPFQYGDLVTSRTMMGGDGAYADINSIIETPTKRRSGYGRLSYELSDSLSAYAEGSWAQADTTTLSTTREDTSIRVTPDNPFLPQSVRTAMAQQGLGSVTVGRYNRDYGTGTYYLRNKTVRGVLGLEGEIGGWNWDAYYTHGDTKNSRAGRNIRNNEHYAFAVDATTDPLTGAAVCRNVGARAAGCIPLNIFGDGAPSPQSIGYVTGDTSWRVGHLTQDAAALSVRGKPLSLWAGPLSVAGGIEYRRDSAVVTMDELTANGIFATGTSVPWAGHVNVKEAFAEVLVPLAENVSWAQSLNLDLAGRLTDYSTSGTVNTWKVGGNWNVNDVLRFRTTLSRDIRAPSLSELYSGTVQGRQDVLDPVLNRTYQVLISTKGNAGLKPEIANTFTAGVVFSNLLIPGFRASIDYYDIKVKDAIAAITFRSIVDRCYRDQPALCSLITRGANTEITDVQASPQNLQSLKARGIDFEASYTAHIGEGSLSLRTIVSYLNHISYNDGLVETVLDGSLLTPLAIGVNGQPKWRAMGSATYELNRATFHMSTRYIGAANISNLYTGKDLDKLRVSPVAYVDLSASYALIDGDKTTAELFVAVQNAFDTAPPATDGARGTEPAVYDLIGRTYTAGLRLKF